MATNGEVDDHVESWGSWVSEVNSLKYARRSNPFRRWIEKIWIHWLYLWGGDIGNRIKMVYTRKLIEEGRNREVISIPYFRERWCLTGRSDRLYPFLRFWRFVIIAPTEISCVEERREVERNWPHLKFLGFKGCDRPLYRVKNWCKMARLRVIGDRSVTHGFASSHLLGWEKKSIPE